jgi:hypothetical protein
MIYLLAVPHFVCKDLQIYLFVCVCKLFFPCMAKMTVTPKIGM